MLPSTGYAIEKPRKRKISLKSTWKGWKNTSSWPETFSSLFHSECKNLILKRWGWILKLFLSSWLHYVKKTLRNNERRNSPHILCIFTICSYYQSCHRGRKYNTWLHFHLRSDEMYRASLKRISGNGEQGCGCHTLNPRLVFSLVWNTVPDAFDGITYTRKINVIGKLFYVLFW